MLVILSTRNSKQSNEKAKPQFYMHERTTAGNAEQARLTSPICPARPIAQTPKPPNRKGAHMAHKRKLEKDIRCPLEYGLAVFGGKWKSRIICALAA